MEDLPLVLSIAVLSLKTVSLTRSTESTAVGIFSGEILVFHFFLFLIFSGKNKSFRESSRFILFFSGLHCYTGRGRVYKYICIFSCCSFANFLFFLHMDFFLLLLNKSEVEFLNIFTVLVIGRLKILIL